MDKLRLCIENQNEAMVSLKMNFLVPLRDQIAEKNLNEVTLATWARLYRLEHLVTAATSMVQIENAMLQWMSTLNESHVHTLKIIMADTLTKIESVRNSCYSLYYICVCVYVYYGYAVKCSKIIMNNIFD